MSPYGAVQEPEYPAEAMSLGGLIDVPIQRPRCTRVPNTHELPRGELRLQRPSRPVASFRVRSQYQQLLGGARTGARAVVESRQGNVDDIDLLSGRHRLAQQARTLQSLVPGCGITQGLGA